MCVCASVCTFGWDISMYILVSLRLLAVSEDSDTHFTLTFIDG